MALVVRPDSPSPRPVRLVESDTLVTRLKALDANTSARLAVKLYNEQAIDLYGMLWAPLEPCLRQDGLFHHAGHPEQPLVRRLRHARRQLPDGQVPPAPTHHHGRPAEAA